MREEGSTMSRNSEMIRAIELLEKLKDLTVVNSEFYSQFVIIDNRIEFLRLELKKALSE
jgi:hypothetical protein